MSRIPKRAVFGIVVCGVVLALVALSLLLINGGSQSTQAQGGNGSNPNILGIDVKIDDNGDTTPDNTKSTLGVIDPCIEVAASATFQVDVFLDDVPTGQDLSSQDYFLNFDGAKLTAVSINEAVGTILLGLHNSSGLFAGSSMGAAFLHSVVMDVSIPAATYAEQPGERGVLGRYTLQATGTGLTSLTLSDVILGNSGGLDFFATDIDEVWDHNFSSPYGIIAIAPATCPAANTPPVAANKTATPDEHVPATVTLTATDAETCTLTFSIVAQPTRGSLGSITNQDCTGPPYSDSAQVTYTPTGHLYGADSFTYRVYDGTDYSNTATVSITVNPINDPPDVTGPTSMTVPEDSFATASITKTDVDDTTFTCAVVTAASHGSVSFDATCATVTYTTTQLNYYGADSFTFRVTDNGGGQGAGSKLSDDQAVSVTVTPVNDAPNVSAPTTMTVAEDSFATQPTTIADVDDATFTCAVVTAASHGSVSFGANCVSVTYTTTQLNYNGADSFTFRVTDNGGGQGAGSKLSDDQAVSVTITAVPDAPICNNINVTVLQNTAKALTLDCSDPDVGDTLTYEIVANPSHGDLTGTAPNLTYTPDSGYTGADSFTYRAKDNTDRYSDTVTASITVSVNPPPTCNNINVTTTADTPVAVNLNCTDLAGDPLTYTIVSNPSHGALSGTAPNLTYTPASGYTGADSFTYKANDGVSDSNIATVSITVTTVSPPAPTPTPTTTAGATPTPTPTPTVAPPVVETALAADVAAGSKEICVEDAEGFSAGDTIEIGSGDTAETRTITAVSDACFTLDSALEFDHTAGEAVVLAAVATSTPTPAEICAPAFPGTYNGTVRLDGVPAADGLVLKALLGDTEWASTSVTGGLYVLDIPEKLPSQPPCFEGGTITFKLNGAVCDQTPEWAAGLHDLDVTCQTPPPPVTPVVTPTVPATPPPPGITPTPGAIVTPAALPPTGAGGLLGGGSAPWTAAVAAGGVLALLLTAVGLSRGARRRAR